MIKIVNNCSSYLNPILNQIQDSLLPIEIFDYIGYEIYMKIGKQLLNVNGGKIYLETARYYIINDLIYVKCVLNE
jgi:hypothetical protein